MAKSKISKKMARAIVLALIVFLAPGLQGKLFAQQYKRALVVDFKNRTGNPGLAYLEASITDAVRKQLKEKYSFQELPPKNWKALAKKNYIFQKDWHTDTAAINLGLLGSQDIVISGYYEDIKGQSAIAVTINIYDVPSRKKVKTLPLTVTLNATMFKQVDEIAATTAKAAASILPNKEAWRRSGLDLFVEPKNHQISLTMGAGFLAHSQSTFSVLEETARVSPDDFSFKLSGLLQYRLSDFWLRHVFAFALFGFDYGFGSFDSEANLSVNANSTVFKGIIGGGYTYIINIRMSVSAMVGGGYAFGSSSFQFKDSNVAAINTTTLELEDAKSLSFTAPMFLVGSRYNYRLLPYLSTFVDLYYMGHFFEENYGGSLYAGIGAGYDF